jgi:hypothetical protein
VVGDRSDGWQLRELDETDGVGFPNGRMVDEMVFEESQVSYWAKDEAEGPETCP